MSRLRQKAISCGFGNVDEAIRDQVIEKCRSVHLWRKFLEKSGNILLKDLQDVARAFEAVDLQMKAMETPSECCQQKTSQNGKEREMTVLLEEQHLTGKRNRDATVAIDGHFARDAQCPARNQVCKRCGKRGHYAVCGKTQGSGKPKWKTSDTNNQKVKICYKVTGNSQGENRDDYAFTVDNTGNESGVVDLKVGGVAITSILIDLGQPVTLWTKPHGRCSRRMV